MATAGYREVVYDDGDQYKGDWNAQGKREGKGTLIFADGSKYQGGFADGMCSGYGVLTFPDNSRFQGQFSGGKYNGFGVYQRADGMKFEGQFQDGQVRGQGLLTFSDGTCGRPRQEGSWQGHQLVQRGNAAEAVRRAQEAATSASAVAGTLK